MLFATSFFLQQSKPNMSTRKVAAKNEVGQQPVCNIKKKHKFYLYKMHYVQEPEIMKILIRE